MNETTQPKSNLNLLIATMMFAGIALVFFTIWLISMDDLTTTKNKLTKTQTELALYKIDGETTYNHFKFSQKVADAFNKGDTNAYDKWMPTFSKNYYALIQQYDDNVIQNLLVQFSECNKKVNALTGTEAKAEMTKCNAISGEIDKRLIFLIEPRYINSYSYNQFQKEPIDANKILSEVKN